MTNASDGTRLVRGPDGRWQVHDVPADEPTLDAVRSDGAVRPNDGYGGVVTPARDPRQPPLTGPLVRRLAMATEHAGPDRHVLVIGDGDHPAAQLFGELRRVSGNNDLGRALESLEGAEAVGQLGLRDGQLVGPGAASPTSPAPLVAGRVLRVVGGPDAGRTLALGPRHVTIGRSSSSTLQLADAAVLPNHVVVQDTVDGVLLHTLGDAGGVQVEGELVDRATLSDGDIFRLGNSLLEVGDSDEADVVTLEHGADHVGIHRRFRTGLQAPPDSIRRPRRDDPGSPQPLNLLLALLPAAGIGAIAIVFGRPEILVFAALSPLLAVARALSSKRTHKAKVAQADADHMMALAAFSTRLAAMREQERRNRRHLVPDPARIIRTAIQPTTDLWSRRASDPDAMTLRVGSASGPSAISVDGRNLGNSAESEVSDQPWLPVTVPLLDIGGLALVGPLDRIRPLARAIVLQAVTLYAPSELTVVFLGGPDAESSWSWLRWLPHLRRGPLETSLLMGTDAGSRTDRIEELRRILAQRRDEGQARPTVYVPRILVIYDNAAARLGEGVAEILREGSELGIHALSLDSLQVPEGCNASVILGSDADSARVDQQGLESKADVTIDSMSVDRCELVARRLASVRVVGEDTGGSLASSCRLLTTLGLEPTATAIRARWAAGSPATRAVVGLAPRRPMALDLTRDGPHALIAGTTGAGKSEFIKTFVASLAMENHPDHLSFLFIDFKGGGDYQGLLELPHTVALTTNLDDPSAFSRTLRMLEAEMARRLVILQGVGTNSIDGYLTTEAATSQPLPRLVVVVDEFAELKDKAPQQLDRLVSVARTGRSAGVHLVLATQRPGGVVTSQIDANVGLRVCFRVKDDVESREILGSELAGRIAEGTRGRCYVRSAATPLTEVQAARVAGARPGAITPNPLQVVDVGWESLGRPLPTRRVTTDVPDADTDLFDLIAAARDAALSTGWRANAIPWPDELPTALSLSDLPAATTTEAALVAVPLGLQDVPDGQRRDVLSVDMGRGHVVIAGSGRTGRSTVLRTFIAGVMQRFDPHEAELTVIDFGGGALLPVERARHCVGLAVEDMARCEELVGGLERELANRRDLFAANGWSDLPAQRAQSDRALPWLVLVVDGWDNLAEEGMRNSVTARLAQLLARGTPQGLQVVIAGDRGTTHSQIARHLTHRYSLRFNRPVDAELQGILARDLPTHQPPGRAVDVQSRRLVQFAQIDDPDDLGQGVAFQRAMVASATVPDGGHPDGAGGSELPFRSQPTDLSVAPTELPPNHMQLPLFLGWDEERREPLWADLADSGGTWFVVGEGGTGRSSALQAMGLASRDTDVVVVGLDSSPVVTQRPPTWRRVPLDADPGVYLPQDGRSMLVLVDDLDLLGDNREVGEILGRAIPRRGVVVSADIDWMKVRFTGLAAAVRRSRCGMVLSPQSTANGVEMFGAGLPADIITPIQVGRAVASLGGGPIRLHVPPPAAWL